MEKTKILLVEDDINLGTLLKEYFNAKGYLTEMQTDGEKGLKAFKREDFDICILDIMLPLKDGFSLAQDIRILDNEIYGAGSVRVDTNCHDTVPFLPGQLKLKSESSSGPCPTSIPLQSSSSNGPMTCQSRIAPSLKIVARSRYFCASEVSV